MNYRNDIVQGDMRNICIQLNDIEQLFHRVVLITGASGMLATYLVYFFMYLNEKKDAEIHVIALVRNEDKAWKKFGDFCDDKYFELLVQDVCEPINYGGHIDYIFHMAGNASPKSILSDPVDIIRTNTLGTINVMELARKSKVEKVIYASTREVYGKEAESIKEIREEVFGSLDPMERRSCYPESKRISESILQSFYYQYGIKSSIVRIAHAYGPGMAIDNDGRVMADFISDVVHNRNIVLKSTGEAIRAFCYISDAITAILFVLLYGNTAEAYNVANETEEIRISKVAELLVELYPEKELKVIFDIPKEMSLGYSKMGRVKLNTEKTEKLGWSCQVKLVDGLRRTVESFK